MKFQHTIHGLSTVSFKEIERINPNTGQPDPLKVDHWVEIQHSAALGLEELQNRIVKLEADLAKVYSEAAVVNLLEKAAKIKEKDEEEPRLPPPPGKPLSQVLKQKGGRPKKAV